MDVGEDAEDFFLFATVTKDFSSMGQAAQSNRSNAPEYYKKLVMGIFNCTHTQQNTTRSLRGDFRA